MSAKCETGNMAKVLYRTGVGKSTWLLLGTQGYTWLLHEQFIDTAALLLSCMYTEVCPVVGFIGEWNTPMVDYDGAIVTWFVCAVGLLNNRWGPNHTHLLPIRSKVCAGQTGKILRRPREYHLILINHASGVLYYKVILSPLSTFQNQSNLICFLRTKSYIKSKRSLESHQVPVFCRN